MQTEKENNKLSKLEVEKLKSIVEKSKKSSYYIGLFSAVAVLIGFSVSIGNVFNLTNKQVEIVDSLKTSVILIDSIKQKEMLEKRLKDSVVMFTISFLKAEKNDSNILKYYAPILETYYQSKNVPVTYIIKKKKRFINAYPKSKFIFNNAGIEVFLVNKDTANVTATGLFYGDSTKTAKQILYKMKVDIHLRKIFSITNYTLTTPLSN